MKSARTEDQTDIPVAVAQNLMYTLTTFRSEVAWRPFPEITLSQGSWTCSSDHTAKHWYWQYWRWCACRPVPIPCLSRLDWSRNYLQNSNCFSAFTWDQTKPNFVGAGAYQIILKYGGNNRSGRDALLDQRQPYVAARVKPDTWDCRGIVFKIWVVGGEACALICQGSFCSMVRSLQFPENHQQPILNNTIVRRCHGIDCAQLYKSEQKVVI